MARPSCEGCANVSRVFGVMSTFRPDSTVLDRARSHAEQVERLIVVDDGSPDSSVLDQLETGRFEVIRLPVNAGIASALNVGTSAALHQGADYVLHLDQDSVLEAGYVERLLATFAAATRPTRLGAVLTDQVNGELSIPPRFAPEGFGLVDEGIQSGMLISAECLRDVGMLDERLFIDCVDIEFCLRIRNHGWHIAVAPNSNIIHTLGRQEPLRPFGIQKYLDGAPVTYQYHPPFREYYITRNNIDLFFRNLRERPRWALTVVKRETGPHINLLTSGPHRAKHAIAIAVGTWHGLTRRRGKIPNWLASAVRE